MCRWKQVLVLWLGAVALAAGCRGGGPAIEPVPAADEAPMSFDDLAVVLTEAVDARGRLDPTALAVHRPRLEHQLALLARPWPAELRRGQGDRRLAWLYNARAAWSLAIVARELRPAEGRHDAFELPAAMPAGRLLHTPFPLDGRRTTLAEIDGLLAGWADFRVAVTAPCATDWAAPLPGRPFGAEDVRDSLERRFGATVDDPRRLVIDHDWRQVWVPAALWRAREVIIMEYNQRQLTRQADLLTALGPHLDAHGRARLADAKGYRLVGRGGTAGIPVQSLPPRERLRRFGPAESGAWDR